MKPTKTQPLLPIRLEKQKKVPPGKIPTRKASVTFVHKKSLRTGPKLKDNNVMAPSTSVDAEPV